MTTKTFTLGQDATADEVADFVNTSALTGTVTVNGVLAKARFGKTASGWGTGSLSVKTPARTTRGTNDVWFKQDTTVTVEVA